jgi:DNA-binding MarR family transcriptional regulator
MNTTRWLDASEQRMWRAWLEVMRLLPDELEDRLQQRHGLNLTDYQVLVELSEAEHGQLRMTELAYRTSLSKSRLSHQIGRMEKVGVVTRRDCNSDRRGAFAVITEEGWAVLRAVAPGHVADVRELMLDLLSPEQVEVLADALTRTAEKLRQRPGAGQASAAD